MTSVMNSAIKQHLDWLHEERMSAKLDGHRWKRIADSLYEAFTDPDMNDNDRQYAIENYRNYAFPDTDNDDT